MKEQFTKLDDSRWLLFFIYEITRRQDKLKQFLAAIELKAFLGLFHLKKVSSLNIVSKGASATHLHR